MVPITRLLAQCLMAAGGIGILLGVLAALFRAGGSGADSWLFVIVTLLWGLACIWIGSRIVRAGAPSAWETVLMLALYLPVAVLAYRLIAGRRLG